MIATAVRQYDEEVALPRYADTKAILTSNSAGINEIKTISLKIEGGLSVLKWIGSALAIGISLGGGIAAWLRLAGAH